MQLFERHTIDTEVERKERGMLLFGFNKRVPSDDESTITPIGSSHKDETVQRPERFYTTQLRNQAVIMRKSARNLLGQRSLATEAENGISNPTDQKEKSPRSMVINARESSSRFRAAELSAQYELNDNEHTTLNPIAVMPTKNKGQSLRSKIPQLKVKPADPVTIMSKETNEGPVNVIPRKSLNGFSRRRSFDVIRNNFGLSQRNLSTSELRIDEFDRTVESRDDTEYRFHQDAMGFQSSRDRTMSLEHGNQQTNVHRTDSPSALSATSQELPDLC